MRGRRVVGGVGAVAAGVLVAAWMLGATALAILGVGLALAAVTARLWAWQVSRSLGVERLPGRTPTVEGEPLRLGVDLRGRAWLASRIELRDRVGPLGERCVPLRPGANELVLGTALRGRYSLGPGWLLVDDPLGMSRIEQPVPAGGVALVRPRVPELGALFSDAGGRGSAGRGRPVRRASGLEPHGVREYVEGEPLRAVHWPTSARRDRLMVRELEDAPRDGVSVVLDLERTTVAGPAGNSSFDEAVRAAAGIVRAHALRAREVLLVLGTPAGDVHRIRTLGADWEEALDALAGVEAVDGAPLQSLLGPRRVAGELVVITGRPETVATTLLARPSTGGSALVAVDVPTYAGGPAARSSPALLRLAAAGVPVAVLRRGVPLEDALGGSWGRAVG
jgi:uncharacterized protein (DUF58 family)